MNDDPRRIRGLMAEFDSPEELVRAVRLAYDQGYRNMEAYSPVPVEGLDEALHFRPSWTAPVVLIGGLLGAGAGFLLQYWTSALHYPVNVGGRPYNSWIYWIPITFETTILSAALFAVVGLLAMNGLPQTYHPVFNVPRFALASRNRFFLFIQATDPEFELHRTRESLESLEPREVSEVEP